MSVNRAIPAAALPLPRREGLRRTALRLALGIAAALAVAGVLALVAGVVAPPPPPRSPFGMGLREAAPAASGLGGLILAFQDRFMRAVQGALTSLDLWSLVGLGFAYGVVHAAGPGHGKAVIAGYLVASDRAVRRGLALSVAAALVQAAVAIALVAVGRLVLGATAASMTRAGNLVETAGFAAVALIGLAMTWRKAGALARALSGDDAACGPGCAHVTLSSPSRTGGGREAVAVVLAAGLRPCAGAVLLLVLAAARGAFGAGVLGVLAMALGTALTTGLLAALAVGAKGLALRLAGARPGLGAAAVAGLELLAGAFVLVLGLSFLAVGAPGA
jgi:nickel/cobalt transporter (NicO) family protein